jgi:hypothetical protein
VITLGNRWWTIAVAAALLAIGLAGAGADSAAAATSVAPTTQSISIVMAPGDHNFGRAWR